MNIKEYKSNYHLDGRNNSVNKNPRDLSFPSSMNWAYLLQQHKMEISYESSQESYPILSCFALSLTKYNLLTELLDKLAKRQSNVRRSRKDLGLSPKSVRPDRRGLGQFSFYLPDYGQILQLYLFITGMTLQRFRQMNGVPFRYHLQQRPTPIKIRKQHRSLEQQPRNRQLDRVLRKEQRTLQNLLAQLEQRQNILFEQNRKRIQSRIESTHANQARRAQFIKRTNQQLNVIKARKQQELIRQARRQLFCYRKASEERNIALQNRRIRMMPLNFHELSMHEKGYQDRRRTSTCRSTSQTPSQNPYKPVRSNTRAEKYVKKQYEQFRKQHTKQINSAKLIIQRRKQYGEKAQKTSRYTKVHTEPSKYTLRQENNKQVMEKQYNSEAKRQRKPKCPPIEGDTATIISREIKAIQSSNRRFTEKFNVLNGLSRSYINKYKHGKNYALQLAAKANLAMADLYLSENF